jgi:ABC-type uncharacterized transport system ATPase subunit
MRWILKLPGIDECRPVPHSINSRETINMVLLDVENLSVYFHTRNGVVKAVDGIDFKVEAGKTLAIIGGVRFR